MVDISDLTQSAHGSFDSITVANFFGLVPVTATFGATAMPASLATATANTLGVTPDVATNVARQALVTVISYGTLSVLSLFATGGTVTAPTAIGNAGTLANMQSGGYDGTAYAGAARITMITNEAWAVGAHGCDLRISTIPATTTLVTIALTISSTTGATSTGITRLIPEGNASLALRNPGNTADNLLLTSAGVATLRNTLTITQGTANTAVLTSTGYSLTGSDATGMVSYAGTWNTSGTPTAWSVAITNTASNAASLLFNWLGGAGGATSLFKMTIAGAITAAGAVTVAGLVTASAGLTVAAGQTLTLTTVTVTGLTAASVGTGTFPGVYTVTGVTTFSAQPILSTLTASQAVFTDSSKGLVSNAITGTGNVVMSASPTLTGTMIASAGTFSSTLQGQDVIATRNVIVQGGLAANAASRVVITHDGTSMGTIYAFGVDNATGGTLVLQSRSSGGGVQVNVASFTVTTRTFVGDAKVLRTGTTLTDGAGVGSGTLTNAPAAGNPTKWGIVDDNGTQRYVPLW